MICLKEEFESPNRTAPNAARCLRCPPQGGISFCAVRLRIQLQALWTTDAVVGIHITHPYLMRPCNQQPPQKTCSKKQQRNRATNKTKRLLCYRYIHVSHRLFSPLFRQILLASTPTNGSYASHKLSACLCSLVVNENVNYSFFLLWGSPVSNK